jgi:hypothetical protein
MKSGVEKNWPTPRLPAYLRDVAREAAAWRGSSLYRAMQRDFAYRMYCFAKG